MVTICTEVNDEVLIEAISSKDSEDLIDFIERVDITMADAEFSIELISRLARSLARDIGEEEVRNSLKF